MTLAFHPEISRPVMDSLSSNNKFDDYHRMEAVFTHLTGEVLAVTKMGVDYTIRPLFNKLLTECRCMEAEIICRDYSREENRSNVFTLTVCKSMVELINFMIAGGDLPKIKEKQKRIEKKFNDEKRRISLLA